ncbi:sugar fermentation stimulation protein B [Escherichia coli]|uniref:helix-turn-helix domain-containing protein n=1 Tax=Escherichia coli TaxID=562 RepID=UPI001917AE22|nr:helix-turn-helix transcriptional regulator [Escherichia coli]CAD5753054.1 sugar fermentation stimulation protein B [Escherichia coli]CAD5755365.1 sugar fermentation stimulation protein B [Escherichia coli]CAD5758860.1 sugar fermentation stimulation protein B [Escherichia coli]
MAQKNWHPADIIAALRKRGTSLAAVSREAGLSSSTLANALIKPWPKGEFLIARAIGVDAAIIWPERYYDDSGRRLARETLIHNYPKPTIKTP